MTTKDWEGGVSGYLIGTTGFLLGFPSIKMRRVSEELELFTWPFSSVVVDPKGIEYGESIIDHRLN